MTKKTSKKKPIGKVFDISRPGKSPAPPTSRPIIMGHEPKAQEAQMAVSGIGENRLMLDGSKKIKIMPSSVNTTTEEPNEQPAIVEQSANISKSLPESQQDSKPFLKTRSHVSQSETEAIAVAALDNTVEVLDVSDPSSSIAKDEDTNKDKSEPEKLVQSKTSDTSDNPIDEKVSDEPEDQALAQAEKKDASSPAAPDSTEKSAPDLSEEAKYGDIFVSQHHHRKSSAWEVVIWLLLVILIAFATLDVLLDMEIIILDSIPHTDLF